MHKLSNLSLSRVCTLFYTWIVILSCTTIGHIFSKFFNVYILTVAIVISLFTVILTRVLQYSSQVKINILLVIYGIIYVVAVFRGIVGLESFLPLLTLVICVDIGSNYSFDIDLARKMVDFIAFIATALLLFQFCVHYLLGIHIQMLPTSILTGEQFEGYKSIIQSGYSNGSSYYRPCSIFLEPSHYVQFTIVAFISALYPSSGKQIQMKKAVFYTVGIIATISSTGIILLIIFWGIWILFSDISSRFSGVFRALIALTLVIATTSMILLSNSVIGVYMQRILPSNLMYLIDNQEGRFWALRYLNSFSDAEWLFGRGIGTEPSGFFTGYTRIVYKMGLLGFLVYVLLIGVVSFKNKGFNRQIGIAYIILLFGAEFDVLRYIVFYLTFVFAQPNCKVASS